MSKLEARERKIVAFTAGVRRRRAHRHVLQRWRLTAYSQQLTRKCVKQASVLQRSEYTAARITNALYSLQSLVRTAMEASTLEEEQSMHQLQAVAKSGIQSNAVLCSLASGAESAISLTRAAERNTELLFCSLCQLQALAFMATAAFRRLVHTFALPYKMPVPEASPPTLESQSTEADAAESACSVRSIEQTLRSSERAARGLEQMLLEVEQGREDLLPAPPVREDERTGRVQAQTHAEHGRQARQSPHRWVGMLEDNCSDESCGQDTRGNDSWDDRGAADGLDPSLHLSSPDQ